MFDTLVLQQLHKLVEGEIGDLPSPQAFHTVYVQRFKSKCIKASTQVSRQFPMPIQTLPCDFPIESCECSHGTPPVIRTFFLTRKTLVEVAELSQGLLQELWTLYLFACGKCQICVLHSEVCPNALTCRRHRFGRSIFC